jgi:hypothetical protein
MYNKNNVLSDYPDDVRRKTGCYCKLRSRLQCKSRSIERLRGKFHSAYSAEFAKVETLEKKLLEVDVISRSVVMQILTARECIQAGLWECRVPRIKIDIIFDYIVDIVEEQMVRQEKGGT